MGGITAAIIAIAGIVLGWITIEIACKPCLEQGRQAIDRSLNPDYDPDDDNDHHTNISIRAPLNPPSKITDNDHHQEPASSRLA
ncbi:outer envelope membrane protein 7 [Apium graveolens]|uniref:outer envelope membrane protein 7 n=1 Tax=Apium graveolens TaxID=4045 RepID=UPI003D7AE973